MEDTSRAFSPASAALTGGMPLMQSGSGQLVRIALTGGTPVRHFGSGQLVRVARTGGMPPRHFGLVQSVRVALTGGVPLMHFGSVQWVRIARTGCVPLMHFGSVHSADTWAGGGPPPQCREPVQALVGAAPPLNEQALSMAAAPSTAPAANL